MDANAQLVLLFGGLHLVGLALVAMLFVMFIRSDTTEAWTPPDENDDGGGGSDRIPPRGPESPRPGGLPLPDALPARARLRSPARLADLTPAAPRRPVREPDRRPVRTQR